MITEFLNIASVSPPLILLGAQINLVKEISKCFIVKGSESFSKVTAVVHHLCPYCTWRMFPLLQISGSVIDLIRSGCIQQNTKE